MTVALSLFSAFAWTAMNYWLVPLSRTVDPYVTSFLILLGSGICTLPVALALDGVPGRGDLRPLAFAMLAGVLEVGGFVCFFRALSRGDLAVVAPIIGIQGGIAALLVFAFGERVSLLVGIGLAVSLGGGCLAAAQGRRRTAAGAVPAFAGALCLGLMFALYAAAEDLGPVSIVAGGRLSAVALLSVVVLRRGLPRPARTQSALLLSFGALDSVAFVAYAYAAARGPVSVAAVVVGQFSTLSAIVGIVLLRERLRPHQYAGIVLAGAGTTLLALAQ